MLGQLRQFVVTSHWVSYLLKSQSWNGFCSHISLALFQGNGTERDIYLNPLN